METECLYLGFPKNTTEAKNIPHGPQRVGNQPQHEVLEEDKEK